MSESLNHDAVWRLAKAITLSAFSGVMCGDSSAELWLRTSPIARMVLSHKGKTDIDETIGVIKASEVDLSKYQVTHG